MRTSEVNESLIGKRVEGISFGAMVTGTVTGIEITECSATVFFAFDKAQRWGDDVWTKGSNWARLSDEFGSLSHMRVLD